jgi:TonB family protein
MKQILLTWALCLTATLGFAQVVDVPEKMAEYPGGTGELMNFLSRSLKYPVECEKSGIEGRVILSFVVNEDGTISNVEGMKSPDERLTAEAKRVVGLMPKWSPAVNKGKAVKMRYTLPFTFRLPDKKRQVLDKGACEELSRLIAGKRENPRGLYRLMGFSYENGPPTRRHTSSSTNTVRTARPCSCRYTKTWRAISRNSG